MALAFCFATPVPKFSGMMAWWSDHRYHGIKGRVKGDEAYMVWLSGAVSKVAIIFATVTWQAHRK